MRQERFLGVVMSSFCVACGRSVPDVGMRCPACTPAHPDEMWHGPRTAQADEDLPSLRMDEARAPLPLCPGSPLATALVAVVCVSIMLAILLPNFVRARGRGQGTSCKSNLKNIATVLEMYSSKNGGRLPLTLRNLVPGYLKNIPTCGTWGGDSYTQGYQRCGRDFVLVCAGEHHSVHGYSANYPQYTSTQGLLER